eukprot:1391473-Amorphochlora_amoeboformis.AAC.2
MALLGCDSLGVKKLVTHGLNKDIFMRISAYLFVARGCLQTLFSVATEFLTALEEKKLEKTLTHFDQTVDSLLLRLVAI